MRRRDLENWLNRIWYSQQTPPAWLRALVPLYRLAFLTDKRLKQLGTSGLKGKPIVVIGNVTVGGSGKTTLVRNALSSGDGLKTRDYWCVSAKFDKVTSSPFSVIRTFLLGLSSQIQTDSAVERCEQLVYEHFQDAAHQWNVLITFAPDIEELFPNGPKEKAIKRDHETSLVSSKNDFNLLKLAIRSFLCVLSIQKPLVLVLDDIMWSDTETFEVL